MTTYSKDQHDAISQLPSAVLLGAMLSDPGSKITEVREFMAGEHFISQSAKKFPDNKLVQEIVKTTGAERIESGVKNILAIGDKGKIKSECEHKIDQGSSALAKDEEGAQFRTFLVNLAEVVVNKTRGGLLGTQGPRVSPQEEQFVSNLKQKFSV
jgi:hypothetical protein